jgi:hypothetical protein
MKKTKYEFCIFDERGSEIVSLHQIKKEELENGLKEHKKYLKLWHKWETKYNDYTLKGKQYRMNCACGKEVTLFVWETIYD